MPHFPLDLCKVLRGTLRLVHNGEVSYYNFNAQDFSDVLHDVLTQEISCLSFQSNTCSENSVFFALVGAHSDGHTYVYDAAQRGAQLVVVEREIQDLELCQLIVPNTRHALACASRWFFDFPDLKIDVIGITGTNGKTTTTRLVAHCLSRPRMMSYGATLGTIGAYLDPYTSVKTQNTTPESLEFQEFIKTAYEHKCTSVTAEISSHALEMHRVDDTYFRAVAFTNLSQDHLDYHEDMESYYQAKRKLFFDYNTSFRVVCVDDHWGQRLAQELHAADIPVTCVSTKPVSFDTAQALKQSVISVEAAHITRDGLQLTINDYGFLIDIDTPLRGRFNIQNIIVCYGICRCLNMLPQHIRAKLRTVEHVRGRMQLISSETKHPTPAVFVDYAHTPDALEKALETIREMNPRHVWVVFGCGGDRDKTKRPLMGAVAAQLAEHLIITSDNPRSEDPDAIIEDIYAGVQELTSSKTSAYHMIDCVKEVQREAAIIQAIMLAAPEDIILIAGKGHEDYQIIGTQTLHFDDSEIAQYWLNDYDEKRFNNER